MQYILLIYALSFNMGGSDYPSMMSAEFADREACEAALAWAKRMDARRINAVCVAKSTRAER